MYISLMDHVEPLARSLLKYKANLELEEAQVNHMRMVAQTCVLMFFCLFVCLFAQCGFTPLIRACSTGKRELVELYLDKGADVNKPAYVCT